MQKDNTQKHLLFEAVMHTVNLNGFHGSSMSMIAKNAQINTSNIYHYFSSKEELIMETFHYVRNMVDAFVFNPEHFKESENYFDEFKLVFKYYVDFYRQKSVYLSFMEQFGKSPYYKQLILEHKNELNGKITEFITKGISQKIYITNDIKCLKTMLFGALNELTYHLFSNANDDHHLQISACVHMLWNAVTQPLILENK